MVCETSKTSDQPARTHILIRAFEYSKAVKLVAEHHLEFLSLKGGCTGSSESTLVKMPHCGKSHVFVLIYFQAQSRQGISTRFQDGRGW